MYAMWHHAPASVGGCAPAAPHHISFAQPRAFGRKVSDAWTVPLCMAHQRSLHDAGNEELWWRTHGVETMAVAKRLWRTSAG